MQSESSIPLGAAFGEDRLNPRYSLCSLIAIVRFIARVVLAFYLTFFMFSSKAISIESPPQSPGSKKLSTTKTINYLVYGHSVEPYQNLAAKDLSAESDNPILMNSIKGIITDIVVEIMKGTNYQLQPLIRPVKRIKNDMKSGNLGNWIGYGFRGWEKLPEWAGVHFSGVDILTYKLVLLSLKKEVKSEDVFSRLYGEEALWIHGYSKNKSLENFSQRFNIRLVYAKSHINAIKMLISKRALFFMEDEARIRYALMKLGIDANDYNFTPVNQFIRSGAVTLVMNADMDLSIKELIDNRLRELVEEGFIDQIISNYQGQ